MANTFFKIAFIIALTATMTACAPMESDRKPVFYTGGSGGGNSDESPTGGESLSKTKEASHDPAPGEITNDPTKASTPDAPSAFGG